MVLTVLQVLYIYIYIYMYIYTHEVLGGLCVWVEV